MPVIVFLGISVCLFAFPARSQTPQEEPLPGPDSHETGQGPHGHLVGDWGGQRTRLLERGVNKGFTLSLAKQVWNGKMDTVIKTVERNVRLV